MKTETTKPKIEATELEFSNLNTLAGTLEYVEAMSTRDLMAQLKKIKLPTKIISIYAYGSVHVAWIMTHAKLKKVKGE